MGVQLISANTAFSFPAGAAETGNSGEGPEDFAELVRQDEVAAALHARDRQRLIERERIAEIGFAPFRREQYEIGKMLRLMRAVAEQASGGLQYQFDRVATDLAGHPPHDPAEMHTRIEVAIACIPVTAPNDLRQRMKDAYTSLKEAMEDPDPELARLRKAEEQGWMQAAFRPEALATAAFL